MQKLKKYNPPLKTMMVMAALLLYGMAAYAQQAAGKWYGKLDVPGSKLRLIFNINRGDKGWVTTMDSPDQGAAGLPTDATTVRGDSITIEARQLGIIFKGKLADKERTINGIFKQGGASLPLVLSDKPTALPAAEIKKRPQDPATFPYKRYEVSFINAKGRDTLAGTLTVPENGKFKKAVILITGSGRQNRDEEVKEFNHRPFLVWSDWLTKQGIAVLRYDDRGMGKSTGDYASATSADFADDANAAVKYLKSRPDMRGVQIGLAGHSEGGMIAPMVAANNKDVKYIVLLAGPGVPIPELMVQQTRDQMRLGGAPDSLIRQATQSSMLLFNAMNKYKALDMAAFKVKMEAEMYVLLRGMPKELTGGKNIEHLVKSTGTQVYNPWFRFFIGYDPSVNLQKVQCPVLAVNGTLDSQVDATTSLAGIKTALEKGGNKNFKTLAMPGLNHMLQKAKTGGVNEYSQIEETVNPAALKVVSDWINGLR